jgi:hypothetical protein
MGEASDPCLYDPTAHGHPSPLYPARGVSERTLNSAFRRSGVILVIGLAASSGPENHVAEEQI